VIKNSLSLGDLNYLSLCYGANRLVIFPYEANYIGVEIEREQEPKEFIERIISSVTTGVEAEAEVRPKAEVAEEVEVGAEVEAESEVKPEVEEKPEIAVEPEVEEKAEIELPRSIKSKVQQINLLVEEFGGEENRTHWLELLNQGIGILGGDLVTSIGVIEENLAFKDQPSKDKENDFVQGLRSIIDFLVKKAVEEMGSSQARAKVQAVIERMK
jgi:hypothetical protein